MPLHDPSFTCAPLVVFLPVQKLMKLASSLEYDQQRIRGILKQKTYVAEAACPAATPCSP